LKCPVEKLNHPKPPFDTQFFFVICRPSIVKKEDEEEKALKEEPVEEAEPKKEPLSLEELLAKKQAEEAARSKVRHFFIFKVSCGPAYTLQLVCKVTTLLQAGGFINKQKVVYSAVS
jgi:hypothetical protein